MRPLSRIRIMNNRDFALFEGDASERNDEVDQLINFNQAFIVNNPKILLEIQMLLILLRQKLLQLYHQHQLQVNLFCLLESDKNIHIQNIKFEYCCMSIIRMNRIQNIQNIQIQKQNLNSKKQLIILTESNGSR